MSITPAHVRGARGVLGWNMLTLARAARVSISTVKRFEDTAQPQSQAAEALRRAFEDHGVEFEAGEGGVVIIRFDPSVRPRTTVFSRFM